MKSRIDMEKKEDLTREVESESYGRRRWKKAKSNLVSIFYLKLTEFSISIRYFYISQKRGLIDSETSVRLEALPAKEKENEDKSK